MAFQKTRDPAQGRLFILTSVLFISYLCVGISLPIISIYVTGQLGLGNFWAGLAVGIAFLSTIVSRSFAGRFSDMRGAKPAVRHGLTFYIAGALISLLSGLLSSMSLWSFAILIAGRIVLGLGESLVAVGIIAWGIGTIGPARSGRVLALVGAAIYGALAIGGPIGLALFEYLGFAGTMAISAVLPCLGIVAITPLAGIAAHPGATRTSFLKLLGRIWAHGSIVCLQGIGFAAIGAFFALHFREQSWAYAGLGLSAFGGGFVLVRIFFGHLPDRVGGLPVAIVSLLVETVGQLLIWSAPDPLLALAGAFLTGLGCSMIFPAMGRDVVRLVEPHLRGTALGGFSAFQDLAYGLTAPLTGILADHAGYRSVFLIGALAAAMGLFIALVLISQKKTAQV
ncbi:MFS transporter [Agrobacterium vitis]|uniref:MFS transporter n=1 Tax=Agrobacterium vitis TaxID=373 RepID=UPI0012E8ED11|nr:MFS transporter [Agrobacterium vitis]MVA23152.1 MFS transporter [Agrobacterium vitis]